MGWSKKQPTIPGYYFYRKNENSNILIGKVDFYSPTVDTHFLFFFSFEILGPVIEKPLDLDYDGTIIVGEWAGPIEEPK